MSNSCQIFYFLVGLFGTILVDVSWLLHPSILQKMSFADYLYPSESTQSLFCPYAYPQNLCKLVHCYFPPKRSIHLYISFLHLDLICVLCYLIEICKRWSCRVFVSAAFIILSSKLFIFIFLVVSYHLPIKRVTFKFIYIS